MYSHRHLKLCAVKYKTEILKALDYKRVNSLLHDFFY